MLRDLYVCSALHLSRTAHSTGKFQSSGFSVSAFETRSLPVLTRSYPRRFTFYVAHPIRSIQRFSLFVCLGPWEQIFYGEFEGQRSAADLFSSMVTRRSSLPRSVIVISRESP
jgi:hypothetical protein